MASKRTAASAIPKTVISSPMVQTSQQKQKTPPPSPPPPITFKDLQDALVQQTSGLIQMFREELRQNNEEFCGNFAIFFISLAAHVDRVDERVEKLEEKADETEFRLEKVEEGVDIVHNDVILSQFREMEFALRIRGLTENKQERLKEEIAAALAIALDRKSEDIYEEIDKAYRINSWYARQKNLPRDVVVYFTRKTRCNEVIQRFYQQRFQIAAQDVILLKEIPPKILRRRKDFAFLAQELKKRQIVFRWDVPEGIVLTYGGNRYRLNTIQKAKDFYVSVLQADLPSSPKQIRKEGFPEQLIVDLPGAMASCEAELQGLQLSEGEVKDQRMTRAAYKRREKERKKETVSSQSLSSQPVGGGSS